jgi:hypothetical protein
VLQTDRCAFHNQLAASLHISQQAKRKRRVAKSKATHEVNKQKKQAAKQARNAGQESHGGPLNDDESSVESADLTGSEVGNLGQSDEDLADGRSDDNADLPEVQSRRECPLKR